MATKGGKGARQKQKEVRAKAKAARKKDNIYLRMGSKGVGSRKGGRNSGYGTFKPKAGKGKPVKIDLPTGGAASKRRAKRIALGLARKRHAETAKRPLQPVRRRLSVLKHRANKAKRNER
jgi:hypothetical protein